MKFRSGLLLLGATIVTIVLVLTVPRVRTQATNSSTPAYITKALADYGRMPNDVWQDDDVKPAEVLKFVGVKPGDKVVDFLPGNRHILSMYWSRIFYKLVGDQGKVYPFIPGVGCRPAHVANCISEREYTSSSEGYANRPVETIMGDPRWNGIDEALDVQHTSAFHNLYVVWDVAEQFAIPEQADVVWSVGHWHELHDRAYQVNMQNFLPQVFESINTKGGVLIIADYASKPGTGFKQVNNLHRSDKQAVIDEVTKAGFVLAGESNIWAKADDDHSKPVPQESMPGVADMFILKFTKPANAAPPRRPTREQMAGWLNASFIMGDPVAIQREQRGGQIWYNADGTEEEYPGIQGSWFVASTGPICLRQEWPPITYGVIGCHESREDLISKKPGDVWNLPAEFGGSGDSGEGGFRAPMRTIALESWHVYPKKPNDYKTRGDVQNEWNNPMWGQLR